MHALEEFSHFFSLSLGGELFYKKKDSKKYFLSLLNSYLHRKNIFYYPFMEIPSNATFFSLL